LENAIEEDAVNAAIARSGALPGQPPNAESP